MRFLIKQNEKGNKLQDEHIECCGARNIERRRMSFFREYRQLFVCAIVSLIVSLICGFLRRLIQLQYVLEVIMDIVNSLAIAILANTVFCYFQVYLPQKRAWEISKPNIDKSVGIIKESMDKPISKIYISRYNLEKDITIDRIRLDDLVKVFEKFDTRKSMGLTQTELGLLRLYKNNVRKQIRELLEKYSSYLSAEQLNLLFKIEECRFYSKIDSMEDATDKIVQITNGRGTLIAMVSKAELEEYMKLYHEIAKWKSVEKNKDRD